MSATATATSTVRRPETAVPTPEGLFGAQCGERYLASLQGQQRGGDFASSVRVLTMGIKPALQQLLAQTPQALQKLATDPAAQKAFGELSDRLLLAGHTLGTILAKAANALSSDQTYHIDSLRGLLGTLNKELLTQQHPVSLTQFMAFKHLTARCLSAADEACAAPARSPIPQAERTPDPERVKLFECGPVRHDVVWAERTSGVPSDRQHLAAALYSPIEAGRRICKDGEALALRPGADLLRELQQWGQRCSVAAEIVREVLVYGGPALTRLPVERQSLQQLHAQLTAAAAGCSYCASAAPQGLREQRYLRQIASELAQHGGWNDLKTLRKTMGA